MPTKLCKINKSNPWINENDVSNANILFSRSHYFAILNFLLNSSKLETQCVTFYIDVFNIYNHKSFEEAMKDKAEGNIESIKWWPRLDMNIHFASVIRVTHNIITIYTSWHDTGNGQRFRTGSRVKKRTINVSC